MIHRGQDESGAELAPLVPIGTTFHSTRVTVASRMARGNVSIVKAMRLLNHSSELVHRSYQRLQAADVADVFDSLQIPGS
jgi:integrase